MFYSLEDNSFEPCIATESDEQDARFSPNGKWLAYESQDSGRWEIYVQAFPGPGGKWQVSRDGGEQPLWAPDGKELFYFDSDGLMAVSVETEGAFRHDTPVRLFDAEVTVIADGYQNYDIAPDGKRFLLLEPVDETAGETGTVTLVQRWRGLLD